MVANEQDEIAPDAPADESLPTEVKKEPKKKTMLLAVIIAVVVIIAAVAAAMLLGGGEDEPPVNSPPTAGARATTDTYIDIGDSVSFESLGDDTDGEIVNYTWDFGDGTDVVKSPTADTVTHTFEYGGTYLVYHMTEDDAGATADNEAAMIQVTVVLWDPAAVLGGLAEDFENTTAPYAFMILSENIIEPNTTVEFNMTSSAAPGWSEDDEAVILDWSLIDSMELDFGDGTAAVAVTPELYMVDDHEYTVSGHYAAMLTVTSAEDVSTSIIRTVHVLSPAAQYTGVVKNPDAFVEATIGEPDYLDPALDYETAGGEILQSVYETLIWYDGSSTSNLVPLLATSVPTVGDGITEDGLNYTFDLRTDVVFHDGTEMTSEDVIYSFQRVLQMHDPSGPGWMLEQVLTDYIGFSVGDDVSTYLDGSNNVSWIRDVLEPLGWDHEIDEDDIKAVSEVVVYAVDDDTVTFRLTHPYPGFLKIMAYTVGSVVSKAFVEAHGGIVGGEQNDYMNVHTCGSGPYELVAWEVGVKVHLTRFDDYWGDAPALKDVYILKANDVNARILMLQAGDADSIYLPIKFEDVVSDTTKYNVVKGLPTFDLTFMAFNFNIDVATANSQYGGDITADFFHDIHMRKAFTMLINYTLYIQNVARDNAIQPNGVVPKGMFGYDPDVPVYEFDVAEAQAELELTSWWTSGFTVPLFYNAGNLGRQTACEMLKANLESIDSKFTATVNPLDWPVFLDEVYDTNGYMPVYSIGWGPDYADPDDYTTPMLDSSYGTYPYFTGYSNSAIDVLVRDAAAELDDEVRAELYSEIGYAAHDDCPYIWLTQPNNFHVERSWVEGYYFNPMFAGLYFPSYSK